MTDQMSFLRLIFAGAEVVFVTDRAGPTIRPFHQAGSLPGEFIFQRGKKLWQGVRSTTKHRQSLPFACPKCGSVVVYDDRGFAFCTGCAWAPSLMTRAERAHLEARDPEMIPVFQFLDRMEQHAPRFEGHANNRKISGKERRDKRFLSKCAAVS